MPQGNLFGDRNDDLPLFSQTPIRVQQQAFEPNQTQVEQSRMATCGICLDTGWVKADPKKKPVLCNCAAGDAIRAKRKEAEMRDVLGALPESKRLARIRQNSQAYTDEERGDDAVKLLREATALDVVIAKPQWNAHEVLQVLLGVGDAILPGRLLQEFGSVREVVRASDGYLLNVRGMTERRVAALRAAVRLNELAQVLDETPIVKSPADAAQLLTDMRLLEQEEMRVVLFDTKNHVRRIVTVYRGSLHTTVIRVAELFAEAIRAKAAAMIVAHNHPSGDPSPSPEDVAVTREIVNAGKLLDIDVLDHLVLGGNKFVSLKERGLGFG
ncbi:MAG: DNA repair protein RadC [Chloroflexi bacterium]|nr:DNA repair protein RadC [Chloroflexota bacterium]